MKILSSVMKKIFGTPTQRYLKSVVPTILRINEFEPAFKALSNQELRDKTKEFKQRLSNGQVIADMLPEAFAAVREAARRFLSMRHYDVQLIGGIVLHEGKIAEMVTGEGKTLVATLPAYLNALEGKGVHVITVNDYLAQRDRDWMAPIYQGLGLSVGAIQSGMSSRERQPEYASDITYGTSNEFGFDYLRDNMKSRLEEQVQGLLHYAIVDEVDSILIDEARTPLIISGSADDETEKYKQANDVVRKLGQPEGKTLKNRFFEISEKDHRVDLTEEGLEKISNELGIDNIWAGTNIEWPHLINNSLKAHHLFKREKQYVIKNGEIIIVDEFTGRLMQGRRWSDGLHQAIEAKEAREHGGVIIRQEQRTLATITLQNYFKLYKKLSGMTGTAITEAGEFYKIYNLEVVDIPTNRKLIRKSYNDVVYGSVKEKYEAIGDEIYSIACIGRPILVGTTTIDRSVEIAGYLKNEGFQIEDNPLATDSAKRVFVLNAKATYENAMRESDIVAQAGRRILDQEKVRKELSNFEASKERKTILDFLDGIISVGVKFKTAPGTVTIATNMAGRGTDILLGGNSGHFFYRHLLSEGFLEAIERAKEEGEDSQKGEVNISEIKSKKKGKKEAPQTFKKSDVQNTLFSELYKLLGKAQALPYPMKDPLEIPNEKEQQAIEKVLAESLQALFPLKPEFFYPDENPQYKIFADELLNDFIDPKIFRDFFEGDWSFTLNEFLARELNPETDLDVAMKVVADVIRLSIPLDEYISRHIKIRQKTVGGDWADELTSAKWSKYVITGEKYLREALLNKLMVICPVFFNDDPELFEEPEFIFSTGGWEEIRKQGGLHIIGTERHEARRIDNQLRGRCGRQGDPGSSQFFLSLDDDLIRVFAGQKIKRMLQFTGLRDGKPLELRVLSNTIEKAQKKVEARNFDMRKNLLEYAEVMDKQRKTIYTMRQSVLESFTKITEKNRFRALRVKKSVKELFEEIEDGLTYERWFDWWSEEIANPKQLDEHDDWLPLVPEFREKYLKDKSRELLINAVSRHLRNYAHYENPARAWNLKEFVAWLNEEFKGNISKKFEVDDIEKIPFEKVVDVLTERIIWDNDPNFEKISKECKGLRKSELANFVKGFQKEYNITFDEDEIVEAQDLQPKQSADYFIEKYKIYGRKHRIREIGKDRFEKLEEQIENATGGWNLPALLKYLALAVNLELTEKDFEGKTVDECEEMLSEKIVKMHEEREKMLTKDDMLLTEQFLLLEIIDGRWLDHLREMDYLRSAVAFSGYAQKDPKIEYKKRGLDNFIEMLKLVEDHFAEKIFKIRIKAREIKTLSDKWEDKQETKKEEAGSILASAVPSAGSDGSDARGAMNEAVKRDQQGEAKLKPIVREHRKIKPNEWVTIVKGKEKREMKYKKAEPLIKHQGWKLLE